MRQMRDVYKTISSQSKGLFKEKGSKFLAYAFPVNTEEEIKEILIRVKKEHHNARHHCYAWRLGKDKITFRANDDGEPSSTAGKPILGQLQRLGVTQVLLIVVRYFGGTLLGTGGLINAYKCAAADALKNAEIVEETIDILFRLRFSYQEMNEVMQILKKENLNIVNTQFELDCELIFSVRKSKAGSIEKVFRLIQGVESERLK